MKRIRLIQTLAEGIEFVDGRIALHWLKDSRTKLYPDYNFVFSLHTELHGTAEIIREDKIIISEKQHLLPDIQL